MPASGVADVEDQVFVLVTGANRYSEPPPLVRLLRSFVRGPLFPDWCPLDVFTSAVG